jgi:hypothetical protein
LLSNPGIPWGHSGSAKGKCRQRIGFGGARNAIATSFGFSPWSNGVIHLYGSPSLYSVCDLNVEMAMVAPVSLLSGFWAVEHSKLGYA